MTPWERVAVSASLQTTQEASWAEQQQMLMVLTASRWSGAQRAEVPVRRPLVTASSASFLRAVVETVVTVETVMGRRLT